MRTEFFIFKQRSTTFCHIITHLRYNLNLHVAENMFLAYFWNVAIRNLIRLINFQVLLVQILNMELFLRCF